MWREWREGREWLTSRTYMAYFCASAPRAEPEVNCDLNGLSLSVSEQSESSGTVRPYSSKHIHEPCVKVFQPWNNSSAQWARITKKTDWSTGPLACLFVCSLAPLTCLLAPHYSLCLRAPLRSLALLARGTVN